MIVNIALLIVNHFNVVEMKWILKNKDKLVVIVILIANAMLLFNVKSQANDIVTSYSETFFHFYGFFPYEFRFSDSPSRNLTINFFGKNCLMIKNDVKRTSISPQLSFCDTVYFHVICTPFNDKEMPHRQIIVDSVASARHFSDSHTVPPYRDINCTDSYMIFPLLHNSDTIFVSMNNRNLRIRDFEFSVNPFVTLPNGAVLKKESIKFPPQEKMRPKTYRKFLDWVEEQKNKEDGLVPDEAILEFIGRYYDWNAY